jgi:hypothetical protein
MSRDTCQRCPETSQCAPGRIRTCDTGFRRAVLYPLSYEGATLGAYRAPGFPYAAQRKPCTHDCIA